jgi:DNA-binding response OmpR family regulator
MSTISKIASPGNPSLPIFRTRKQGRVLLLEPDSKLNDRLRSLLASQGYESLVARDLVKAYSLSRFKGYAFILLNWFIGNQTALELCKYIRSVNKTSPLFFYTPKGLEADLHTIEPLIQGYGVKHIQTNIMLKTIFQHLETESLQPSAVENLV